MTTKAHKDLTGVDLHEPKGVSAATSGQVYKADGVGSGSWQTLVIPTGLFIINTVSFTSSGTWTKPANLFFATVHCVGSGSAGNVDATTPFVAGGSVSFGTHVTASGGGGSAGGNTAPSGGAGDVTADFYATGAPGLKSAGDIGSAVTAPITGGYAAGPWGPFGSGSPRTGNASAGNGAISGAGGGYSRKYLTAASLGTTEAVTVGTTGANNALVVVEQYISI